MADILSIEPNSIGANTMRDNTPRWDSTNHISLCLALEEEFGIVLEVEEIESMFSYPAVLRVIEAKI